MIGKLTGFLGGRRSAGGVVQLAHPEAVACSRVGCAAMKSWRCEYRDAAGHQCGWWCREHLKLAEGHVWCHRHANTVRELSYRRDTIYEIKTQASLEDRSPSLCSLVVEDIDGPVSSALRGLHAGQPLLRVVTDPGVREVRPPREHIFEGPDGLTVERIGYDRAWERGWGVVSNQGYVARVLVRVSTTEPPSVQVLVNGHTVSEGVPDWITARAEGRDSGEGERQAYADRVLQSILNELNDPS